MRIPRRHSLVDSFDSFVKKNRRILLALSVTVTVLFVFALLARPARMENGSPGNNVFSKRDTALPEAPGALRQASVENYLKLPPAFEINQGQLDSRVKFVSRGRGYSLYLTDNSAVFSLVRAEPAKRRSPSRKARGSSLVPELLSLKFAGGNPSPNVTGTGELSSKTNYFRGNDPKKWRTDVSSYRGVNYDEVYPGIDVDFYGKQGQLEYDVVVGPGADVSKVRLVFAGARKLSIDKRGDLSIWTKRGRLIQPKPIAYQEVDGAKRVVASKYVVSLKGEVGFQVESYDAGKPLIIDPTLIYSTFLGGSDEDRATAIAVDSSGSVYVTGLTASLDFPISPGAPQNVFGGAPYDAFVTKLSPAGDSIVYSTYLGGNNQDVGMDLTVDSSGAVYVTGNTLSVNYPTTAGAFQTVFGGAGGLGDAFVTKISATGDSLVYSTYLGGSFGDRGWGIAVDGSDNALVTGETRSINFPLMNQFQGYPADPFENNVFVTKLNATGTALLYSTYLGGNSADLGTNVAVDPSGKVYVTGMTQSTNFPTVNPFQSTRASAFLDAFVAKIDTDLVGAPSLVYSTYLGGNGEEDALGIAVNAAGNAYVTGHTHSTDFPTTAGSFQAAHAGGIDDAFVTMISVSGSALVYSTYLGGNSEEQGHGIALDGDGNAYITGNTLSLNFPQVNPFLGYGGSFVTKVNSAGSALIYSSYIVGSGNDMANGIALDNSGNAYVVGETPNSPNTYPVVNAAQPTFGGFVDGFIVKIGVVCASNLSISGTVPDFCEGGSQPVNLTLNGTNLGNSNITWSLSGPSPNPSLGTGTNLNVTLSALLPGSYTVIATATNSECPDTSMFVSFDVNARPAANAGVDQVFCETSSTNLAGNTPTTGTGTWTLVGGSATIVEPHNPNTLVTDLGYGGNFFRWTVTDGECSNGDDIVAVERQQTPTTPDAGPDQVLCETSNSTLTGNAPAVGFAIWELVSGVATITDPFSPTTTVTGLGYGTNLFQRKIDNGQCGALIDHMTITRNQTPTTADAGPDQAFCENSATTLGSNPPVAGIGTWTVVSGTGIVLDPHNPTSIVTNLSYGPNVIRWTISNGSCGSSIDDVVVTRNSCPTDITLFSNRDSFLRSGSDDTNEGANERLRIQSSGNNRAVVAFDLTNVSTEGLQSATLVLTIAENSNNWGPSGRLVDAQRLLVDWTEGNGRNDVMVGGGPGFRGNGEGVTWHCAQDINIFNQVANCSPLWNGGTYAAATAPGVLHFNSLLGEVSWNVTADILAGANFGWVIRKQNEGQNGQIRYYSREGAALAGNSNLAPRLILVYSN